jgi:hypothetical protein
MSWFEVDKEGLKRLLTKKDKTFILRELVQNAWDEPISICKVKLKQASEGGYTYISVEDDSPIGFRDLTHAYTLFGDTYKRRDASKRGRYNLGDKLVFSVCKEAIVETTKGTIVFDENGRRELNIKKKSGSKITVKLTTTKKEFKEMYADALLYIPPKSVKYYVNGTKKLHQTPYKTFETSLITEIEKDEVMSRTKRKTEVNLYDSDRETHYIYEMGIPICEIDCKFDIDVQQKIPLTLDRETVLPSFLKDVYAEVLNQTYDKIEEEESSQLWVRQGMSDDRISKKATETIIKKRYGNDVVVANRFDANSIDEAISRGYRVISGSELSKDEWSTVKKFDLLQSTSDLFGSNFKNAKQVKDTSDDQKRFAKLAKRIARRLLNLNINVNFVKDNNLVAGQFGYNTLMVNLAKFNNRFFKPTISSEQIDFIVHELGHHAGHHTEKSYHELITKMAGQLTVLALKEPEFFDEKIKSKMK